MTTATDAWEALHRAQSTVQRRLQGQPEFSSLTFREYDVLTVLAGAGDNGLRLKELNEHVTLSQSSLSRMLERLDKRALVNRWQDPDDARGLRINLTAHGRTTHTNIQTLYHHHVHTLLTNALTPDQLTALTHLTTQLRNRTRKA